MSAPGQGGDAAQQGQNGNGGEGEGQGEAQQQQAQPDFSAMMSQLEQLSGSHEEMRQHLLSNPWQAPEQEAEEQGPSVDLQQLHELGLATGDDDMDRQTADGLAHLMEQIADQKADQKAGIALQQIEELKQEMEFERLANEFPELRDKETADEAVSNAHLYAQGIGSPELASKAGFVRLVHVAMQAFEAAQNEGSGDPGVAHIEGGGGAVSGGSQPDPADEIMNAGGKKGSSVLPF